jgi:K+-dependent Na+/Ca+ exchanger-like protein
MTTLQLPMATWKANTRAPRPRRLRRALLLPTSVFLAVAFAAPLANALWRSAVLPTTTTHRHLLAQNVSDVSAAPPPKPAGLSLVTLFTGSPECNTMFDNVFTVPVYFALVLYTFVGLAIVCDEYFCESLEKISAALHLSDDVAGATFMAAGSSAPELFTAIVTIFISPGEQGVGTIVGSAVFNICVIVGITSLCAGQVLDLWWYPLIRDSSFYALSIAMMVWAMADGQVSLLESTSLVSVYFLYVGTMMVNERIVDFLRRAEVRASARASFRASELKVTPFAKLNPLLSPQNRPAHFRRTSIARKVKQEQVKSMLVTALTVNRAKTKLLRSLSSRSSGLIGDGSTPPPKPTAEPAEDDEESTCLGRIIDIISWPLAFSMELTIPDCRKEEWEEWYFATFTMSIMWIGILSFLMIDFAARAGCILQIPEFLMGLTVLAAGTSVPDALSSVLVARNGQGNMAVCNVLGSNVFNILLGLGFPWMIASLLAEGEPYPTGSGNIIEPTIILFGYLIAFVLILMLFNWKLTPGLGYLLLFGQVCYTGWNIGRNYGLIPLDLPL